MLFTENKLIYLELGYFFLQISQRSVKVTAIELTIGEFILTA